MGYRIHTLSPDTGTPTGQVADREFCADYEDVDAVAEFARSVSVVTFEFENVSSLAAAAAERHAPVRPAGKVLHTTQNRVREKAFLTNAGLPVAPYRVVRSADELRAAIDDLGTPAILKTAGWGYDGKGQSRIEDETKADEAWRDLDTTEAVLEAFVDFELELSVVAARGTLESGSPFAAFDVAENRHHNHILDVSIAPALSPTVSPTVSRRAGEIARAVLEQLDVVGLLCVEMFLTGSGELLVNELAPRPHNSGHLTFDACVTSQFEQQLRAVCGLPLGSVQRLRPTAMANLLGDLWFRDGHRFEPNWAAACAHRDVKLHLYGKSDPRPGRKMGHLTAFGSDAASALRSALEARDALST